MTDDLALDERLRALDAAPADDPIDRNHQKQLLESLLSDEDRRPLRRLAWIGAAAATVAAAAVVVPATTGGQPAFADWTSESSAVAPADAEALRTACLDQVGATVGGDGAPEMASSDPATRLADRRGDWVSVLLTSTRTDRYQFTVACLGRLPGGSTNDPKDVTHVVSGGGGFGAPDGHELVEGAMAEFTVGGGFLGLGHSERAATTHGEVGPEVAAVTLHAGGQVVEASVEDGTYAAWWPGPLFASSEAEASVRYDVTLRDGTVLYDVDPVHPPA